MAIKNLITFVLNKNIGDEDKLSVVKYFYGKFKDYHNVIFDATTIRKLASLNVPLESIKELIEMIPNDQQIGLQAQVGSRLHKTINLHRAYMCILSKSSLDDKLEMIEVLNSITPSMKLQIANLLVGYINLDKMSVEYEKIQKLLGKLVGQWIDSAEGKKYEGELKGFKSLTEQINFIISKASTKIELNDIDKIDYQEEASYYRGKFLLTRVLNSEHNVNKNVYEKIDFIKTIDLHKLFTDYEIKHFIISWLQSDSLTINDKYVVINDMAAHFGVDYHFLRDMLKLRQSLPFNPKQKNELIGILVNNFNEINSISLFMNVCTHIVNLDIDEKYKDSLISTILMDKLDLTNTDVNLSLSEFLGSSNHLKVTNSKEFKIFFDAIANEDISDENFNKLLEKAFNNIINESSKLEQAKMLSSFLGYLFHDKNKDRCTQTLYGEISPIMKHNLTQLYDIYIDLLKCLSNGSDEYERLSQYFNHIFSDVNHINVESYKQAYKTQRSGFQFRRFYEANILKEEPGINEINSLIQKEGSIASEAFDGMKLSLPPVTINIKRAKSKVNEKCEEELQDEVIYKPLQLQQPSAPLKSKPSFEAFEEKESGLKDKPTPIEQWPKYIPQAVVPEESKPSFEKYEEEPNSKAIKPLQLQQPSAPFKPLLIRPFNDPNKVFLNKASESSSHLEAQPN
ncbi:hypothetical protein L3V83_05245 [Thiotrichales bacterium 19X7-9]|nr:hypothetical protein [Thiotrichales bacterium 19X7-9]